MQNRTVVKRDWVGMIATAVLVVIAVYPIHAQSTTQPSTVPADQTIPHVHLDWEHHWVEVDAEVAQWTEEWIELLACSPKTLEYESLMTVHARPSHIHLALLLIGLEPGHPLSWHQEDGQPVVDPPEGPQVAVTLIYEQQGKRIEVSANEWIVHIETGEIMPDNLWLFTGSRLHQINGKQVYAADVSGSVLSLVNFGDDVLARPGNTSNKGGGAMWTANKDRIPPVGTPITIRLQPVEHKHQPQ